jgi:NAD(P)-dependent dehydrogenase (short-subunit alcohol dehydrogenase family)
VRDLYARVRDELGRIDVLATVAYLASDDAGYVTASAFPLDGGITARTRSPARRIKPVS